jgi:hypothetical protein
MQRPQRAADLEVRLVLSHPEGLGYASPYRAVARDYKRRPSSRAALAPRLDPSQVGPLLPEGSRQQPSARAITICWIIDLINEPSRWTPRHFFCSRARLPF